MAEKWCFIHCSDAQFNFKLKTFKVQRFPPTICLNTTKRSLTFLLNITSWEIPLNWPTFTKALLDFPTSQMATLQHWSPCGQRTMGPGAGNMIISTSMNINLGHLGGASIFAKIHSWRHFIEMFFFHLLWRGILISLNLYLFLVTHDNFTMSCYPNSALTSVMIPLSPNSFGHLWIEKLLLVLCLNTPRTLPIICVLSTAMTVCR